MYVPLIVPAEALLDPPEEVTGPVSAELDFLGVDTPSELAWDNVMAFIERYFLDSLHNWLADTNTIIFEVPLYWSFKDSIASSQVTIPELNLNNLYNLFAMYEELQCYDHPNRLTPLFIWKDSRGDRKWSKQPHTKRNIRSELGITQPLHAVLNQALKLLGRYLTGKVDVPLDTVEFQTQLGIWKRDNAESLYACSKQQRGYMKYWMTNAFDAFSRPDMEMDTDMQSWTSMCDGAMIQPRPDLIKRDTDEPLRFYFRVRRGTGDEEDEVDQEVDGGDEEMEVDEEDEEDEDMEEDIGDE
jgi:hypothetical protein